MQNDVMKNVRTPVGIKNLISNSLVQHNQLQYNPSVSTRSGNPNELKPIIHDHINTRFTKVPYKTEVRPEAYSNFVLNNTFKYGVGSQNIYQGGVYIKQRQSTLYQSDSQVYSRSK